ncbi:hypothetical protein PW52_04745 [Tamlana sedimentorum]|uniref:Secretion system C-terminal sorting domain-containing protein n=1 Tax=Neotamlana sedimentorum TaxID=1435349 RepID=A0A0D7WBH4_9FLAO|nr:T9SS type A sorting domain-containing protein [Tamlana sedimentorum]KJD36466.1 hypothetical protein PW52_04745 [Tamlana sedimentorum]
MKNSLIAYFVLCCGIFASSAQSIGIAEYFFNNDPGIGNGNTLTVNNNSGILTQTFSIPTSELNEGHNSLYIRTQNSENKWSLYDRKNFYLVKILNANIVEAEYFFNEDLGIGNGSSLTVNSNTGELTQTFSIPITTLPVGFNSLYIRTKTSDNQWSLYDRENFYIVSLNNYTVKAAEYFFNTDPGVGNGNAISINDNDGNLTQLFTIPTDELLDGFNSFYLRTQDNANHWSLYDRKLIYIKNYNLTPDEVIAAEYFIDEDLGIGNGTPFNFVNPSESTQMLSINTNNLEEGEHMFYIRVQDSNGDWSIYDSALFTIDASLSTKNSILSSVSLYPNPVKNELNIKIPNHINIKETKIYNNVGQKVYQSLNNNSKLNLKHLESGMYILILHTDAGDAAFKILKN